MIITDRSKTCFAGLWLAIFLLFSSQIYGQKDPLKEGNKAFEKDHFREALIYYNQIEKISSSAPILFKRGVCYYEINQLDNALEDFRRAWEYGYTNPEVDYYTGLIQHHRGNFAIAATYYKNYLKEIDEDDIIRPSVRKLIKQCGRAIDLYYKNPLAIVEKLPGGVNTAYDEIGLVESPSTQGKYYYTSNKPNLTSTLEASDFDVYWVTKTEGEWSEPKRMPYIINKSDNDILLGFTPVADGVYFYRGKDHQGDIMLNKGIGKGTRSKPVGIPATTSLINSDVFFFDDKVMLFSSKESQGYGGYDLYASINQDGFWSSPINLGPEINGPYDEVSPYLSYDGSELYFSSNRDESIGNLDVFVSKYLYEADKWQQPQNMGMPINSPGDDSHYSLSYDGLTAMITSDRKNSFGGKDNYIIRFKDPQGSQGYGVEELAFLQYKITDRDDIEIAEGLEKDLAASSIADTSSVEPAKESVVTNEATVEPIATANEKSQPAVTPVIEEDITTRDGSQQNEGTDIAKASESMEVTKDDTPIAIATPTKVIKEEPETFDTVAEEVVRQPIPPGERATTISEDMITVKGSYEPIYYSSGLDLINDKNIDNIESLVDLMIEYPDLEAEFNGHSTEEGILEYKLFSSLKIAERLQQHFKSKGISEERIHIKGVADNYPIAKSESDGGDPKYAGLYNSRVEVKFFNYDKEASQLERRTPAVPDYSKDISYDLYSTLVEDAVIYKIQIAVVSQMYRGKALDLFNDTSVEENEQTGLYAYTIGLYDNFADALQVKRDIDRLGFTDAKVVAYYNGRRLTDDQYVYYVNNFPDLRGLMNYKG